MNIKDLGPYALVFAGGSLAGLTINGMAALPDWVHLVNVLAVAFGLAEIKWRRDAETPGLPMLTKARTGTEEKEQRQSLRPADTGDRVIDPPDTEVAKAAAGSPKSGSILPSIANSTNPTPATQRAFEGGWAFKLKPRSESKGVRIQDDGYPMAVDQDTIIRRAGARWIGSEQQLTEDEYFDYEPSSAGGYFNTEIIEGPQFADRVADVISYKFDPPLRLTTVQWTMLPEHSQSSRGAVAAMMRRYHASGEETWAYRAIAFLLNGGDPEAADKLRVSAEGLRTGMADAVLKKMGALEDYQALMESHEANNKFKYPCDWIVRWVASSPILINSRPGPTTVFDGVGDGDPCPCRSGRVFAACHKPFTQDTGEAPSGLPITDWRVKHLRNLAKRTEEFPIPKKDIDAASKDQLVEAFLVAWATPDKDPRGAEIPAGSTCARESEETEPRMTEGWKPPAERFSFHDLSKRQFFPKLSPENAWQHDSFNEQGFRTALHGFNDPRLYFPEYLIANDRADEEPGSKARLPRAFRSKYSGVADQEYVFGQLHGSFGERGKELHVTDIVFPKDNLRVSRVASPRTDVYRAKLAEFREVEEELLWCYYRDRNQAWMKCAMYLPVTYADPNTISIDIGNADTPESLWWGTFIEPGAPKWDDSGFKGWWQLRRTWTD